MRMGINKKRRDPDSIGKKKKGSIKQVIYNDAITSSYQSHPLRLTTITISITKIIPITSSNHHYYVTIAYDGGETHKPNQTSGMQTVSDIHRILPSKMEGDELRLGKKKTTNITYRHHVYCITIFKISCITIFKISPTTKTRNLPIESYRIQLPLGLTFS
jgi:hypothetical protein